MGTSTKWRVRTTANNGGAKLALGAVELRSTAGVASPFVRPTFATTITPRAASIMGPNWGGWDSYQDPYSYTYARRLPLGWPLTIGTRTVNDLYLADWGTVGFHGAAEQLSGMEMTNPDGRHVPWPHIDFTSKQAGGSMHKLYNAGFGTATRKYRQELNKGLNDATPATSAWELTFFQNTPNFFQVDFDYADFNTAAGAPAVGVGDGTTSAYVGTFANGYVQQGYDVTIHTVVPADGVASASTASWITYENGWPEFAADPNTDTCWKATTSTGWWQYEFTSPRTITEYVLRAPTSANAFPECMPRDFVLEYWNGSAWVAEDTRTAQIAWTATESRTFTVGVPSGGTGGTGGTGGDTGGGGGTPPPGPVVPNDHYATATALTGRSGAITATTVGAVAEADDPSSRLFIWYTYVPPYSGSYVWTTYTTDPSDRDTILTIRQGDTYAGSTQLDYNDDSYTGTTLSAIDLKMVAGTTYHIGVGNYDTVSGPFTLDWQQTALAVTPGQSDGAEPAAGTGVTASKWRITVTAWNGGGFAGFREVQFRPVAGIDAPLSSTLGTASASSTFGPYVPAWAGDGIVDDGHSWYPLDGTTTQWWQFDFNTPIDVQQYGFQTDGGYNGSPSDWTLSYWDGAQWVVADTVSGLGNFWYYHYGLTYFTVGANGGPTVATGAGLTTKKKWRLSIESAVDTEFSYPAITDWQLRPTAGVDTPLLTLPGKITASNPYSADRMPIYATDGLNGSAWYAGSAPAWIAYEFDTPVNVVEYAISTPSRDNGPMAFTLSYWNGSNWIVADTRTGQDGDAWQNDGTTLNVYSVTNTGGVDPGDGGGDGGDGGGGGPVVTGSTADGDPDLSLALLAVDGALDNALRLPLLSVGGRMVRGNTGRGAVTLPALSARGAMDGPLALPGLTLAGQMQTGAVGAAAANALMLPVALAGTMAAGSLSTGSAILETLTSAASTEGILALQAVGVTATGDAGNTATGALRLLSPTVSAVDVPDNQAGLPALSATGDALTGTVGVGALTLPLLAAQGGLQDDLPLPGLALSGTADSGRVGTANAALSALTLSAQAAPTEAIGTGAATFAPLTMAGVLLNGREAVGNVVLALPSLSAQAVVDGQATGDALLAGLALGAAGFTDNAASATLALATFVVAGTGTAAGFGAGAATLAAITLSASAAAGTIGSAELTVPLMAVAATGFTDVIGTATVRLPLLALQGTATQVAVVVENVQAATVGVALNTHTRAVSTYAGLSVNSLAQFGGVTLAATPTGIVALVGNTDGGAPIAAEIVAGVSDLATEQHKRVLCAYAGYHASGTLELTMITDGHHEYVYRLLPLRLGDLHAARVPLGRGVSGRYWQWKLANRDGADFALDALSLDVVPLSRRV